MPEPIGRNWRNIALTGYRGCGKSSVGRALARRLNWPWIDLDEEVERMAAKPISQLFAEEGEAVMRDWEQRALAHCAEPTGRVLSLGGGAVLREANRRALEHSWTVWLEASPSVLAERLARDQQGAAARPRLTSLGVVGEIETVLAQRLPLYQEVAWRRWCAETRTPSELADAIADQLDWDRYVGER